MNNLFKFSIICLGIAIGTLPPAIASAQIPHYMFQWGVLGSGTGQFSFPHGVALETDGDVYVVDTANNRVQKFTAGGIYLKQWGTAGDGQGQFNEPWWLALDGQGNVYVSDSHNHRIQKFTRDGAYITQWGTAGGATGQFQYPSGIAVDPEGNVFVADSGNNRIQKFTSTGVYLTQWAFGNDRWDQPRELAVDFIGNVWVADRANYCIQKFSTTGAFLTKWTGSSGVSWAQGLTVDAVGDVFVVDGRGAVEKYTPDGALIARWGSYGTGNGEFISPTGIAVNPGGDVYVVDANRVQVFGMGPVATKRISWAGVKQLYR